VTELEFLALIEEERAGEEACREMLRTPQELLGPLVRDEFIFHAICVERRPAEEVAAEFGLAPRTARNIARETQRRLARTACRWSELSPAELAAERERLLALREGALMAWEASRRPRVHRRISHGRFATRMTTVTCSAGAARWRFLILAERAMTDLTAIERLIARRETAEPGYAKRARRRKSLSGKVLRVPLFVRARRVSSAVLIGNWVRVTVKTEPARCRGDPAERAAERNDAECKSAAWALRAVERDCPVLQIVPDRERDGVRSTATHPCSPANPTFRMVRSPHFHPFPPAL
jgi:hypothetical protein